MLPMPVYAGSPEAIVQQAVKEIGRLNLQGRTGVSDEGCADGLSGTRIMESFPA